MGSMMVKWLTFMARKFQEEDFINEMEAMVTEGEAHNERHGQVVKGYVAATLPQDSTTTSMG